MPVYDPANDDAWPVKYASAQDIGYRDGKNPFPVMDFNRNKMRQKKLLANFYVKVDLIPDKLSFQTTYNLGLPSRMNETWTCLISFQAMHNTPKSAIVKKSETFYNQIFDNVLTYNQAFGNHFLTRYGRYVISG
jgi:hypothetical protein